MYLKCLPDSQQAIKGLISEFRDLGPVARSLVSANRWLRGLKTHRFPWYLTLISANHASSNPGLRYINYTNCSQGHYGIWERNLARVFIFLSPGQTIEPSWIQHATLLDVNVEVVAKHHPTLLDETDSSSSWR